MARYSYSNRSDSDDRAGWIFLLFVVIIGTLILSRAAAGFVIDYQWWKEIGQLDTWLDRIAITLLPVTAAAVLAFVALWIAHARALKFAGTGLSEHRLYARVTTAAALVLGILIASASLDTWTVVRYFGSRQIPVEASTWRDPVFGQPLAFYLFQLPFYENVRSFIVTTAVVCALIYFVAGRGWQLRFRIPEWRQETGEIDPNMFKLEGGSRSMFLRGVIAVFILGLAASAFLGRYSMVLNDHSFMVGVDYVDEHVTLPLRWFTIAAYVLAAISVLAGRWFGLVLIPAAILLESLIPGAVARFKVRPNEISMERPYIERHLEATRQAFGFSGRLREVEFKVQPGGLEPSKHPKLLENVRLWDLQAFHNTITQIQALRPYYRFFDNDVDRYMLDGQLRQVLLSPRELDINLLPDARSRWINPHFVYTHGYGMVVSEVAKITPEGLPFLLIQDAPPVVRTPSLKLTRPEIYYGEVVHEPIFVRTAQMEFNYPSGDSNVQSKYEGTGGFPISSFFLRVAAAVREGDFNILLTDYLTPESRMIIRRDVRERLQHIADFIQWDADPYLVINESGRLVWTVDGYTTSNSHPYSRSLRVESLGGALNYIRNSVKATVDAYDGTTRIFVFDSADPIIRVWQSLFPKLFSPASEMPADIRMHTRYPEMYFRIQAEIYRTFHMTDAQAFYNKEDVWDVARTTPQGESPRPMTPTYVVVTLDNSDKPEFALLMPFTPRNKDNLVGLMIGRSDGDQLGEIMVLELSKQELIYGPMQIAARINQDSNISKDLALWNQQGSSVIRGQILVLPIGNSFLYVEPIYIQANEARMPQLKRVVVAEGNKLAYAETYEQALAQLAGMEAAAAPSPPPPSSGAAPQPTTAAPPPPSADPRLEAIRQRMRRYRELSSQGKWSEAGRELEAIESELSRR
jgi:uncharacterized membrane protein (UPF0182 family)